MEAVFKGHMLAKLRVCLSGHMLSTPYTSRPWQMRHKLSKDKSAYRAGSQDLPFRHGKRIQMPNPPIRLSTICGSPTAIAVKSDRILGGKYHQYRLLVGRSRSVNKHASMIHGIAAISQKQISSNAVIIKILSSATCHL